MPDGRILYGDANCDETVDISDAVLMMQFLANPEKYPISDKGLKNADCVDSDGLKSLDALAVQMVEAGTLDQKTFPVTAQTIQSLQK